LPIVPHHHLSILIKHSQGNTCFFIALSHPVLINLSLPYFCNHYCLCSKNMIVYTTWEM
jgi:hypothetical protein